MTHVKEIAEALEIFESEVFKNFIIHRASSGHNGEHLEILSIKPSDNGLLVNYVEGWQGYPQHNMDGQLILDELDWVTIKNLWDESKGGI